jgi:hypothetical protein
MADTSEIVYYVGPENGGLKIESRLNETAHCSISLTWTSPAASALYLRVRDNLPIDQRNALAAKLRDLADAILERDRVDSRG